MNGFKIFGVERVFSSHRFDTYVALITQFHCLIVLLISMTQIFFTFQLKNYKPQTSEIVISINLVNKEAIMDYRGRKVDHQSVFLIGDQDNAVVFKWRIMLVTLYSERKKKLGRERGKR